MKIEPEIVYSLYLRSKLNKIYQTEWKVSRTGFEPGILAIHPIVRTTELLGLLQPDTIHSPVGTIRSVTLAAFYCWKYFPTKITFCILLYLNTVKVECLYKIISIYRQYNLINREDLGQKVNSVPWVHMVLQKKLILS